MCCGMSLVLQQHIVWALVPQRIFCALASGMRWSLRHQPVLPLSRSRHCLGPWRTSRRPALLFLHSSCAAHVEASQVRVPPLRSPGLRSPVPDRLSFALQPSCVIWSFSPLAPALLGRENAGRDVQASCSDVAETDHLTSTMVNVLLSRVGEGVGWEQSVHPLARSATDVLGCFACFRVSALLPRHRGPFVARCLLAGYDLAGSPGKVAPGLHRGRQRPRASASPSRPRYSQYSPRRNRPNMSRQAFPHHSAVALFPAARPGRTGTPDNLLPVGADSAKNGPAGSACRPAR